METCRQLGVRLRMGSSALMEPCWLQLCPCSPRSSAHRRTHVPGSSLSASRSGKQRSVCNRSAEPRPAGGTGRCVGVRWDEDIPWNRSRPQLRTGWPACPGKAGVPGGTGDAGTAARRMRRAEQRDRLDSGCVTPGDVSAAGGCVWWWDWSEAEERVGGRKGPCCPGGCRGSRELWHEGQREVTGSRAQGPAQGWQSEVWGQAPGAPSAVAAGAGAAAPWRGRWCFALVAAHAPRAPGFCQTSLLALPWQALPAAGGLGDALLAAGGLGDALPAAGGLGDALPADGRLGDALLAAGGLGDALPAAGGLGDALPAAGGLGDALPADGRLGDALPAAGGLSDALPAAGGLGDALLAAGGLSDAPQRLEQIFLAPGPSPEAAEQWNVAAAAALQPAGICPTHSPAVSWDLPHGICPTGSAPWDLLHAQPRGELGSAPRDLPHGICPTHSPADLPHTQPCSELRSAPWGLPHT
ncbi:chloride intracellular channel protein 6-like isoform X2 [Columba livia]|uniref:chloride intracellular channel protein 6-like isoform X2 n=1 Tax=Columba livia TaxID=8932 RepID=UPI0031BAA313